MTTSNPGQSNSKSGHEDAEGRQFVVDPQIPWEDLGGGLKRKIMSFEANMMMVKIVFEKGSVGIPHNHVHTQMSYVESGAFEVIVGDEEKILKKGDAFYAPSYVMHGVVCREAGVLIDIFSPMREDFLE